MLVLGSGGERGGDSPSKKRKHGAWRSMFKWFVQSLVETGSVSEQKAAVGFFGGASHVQQDKFSCKLDYSN